MADSFVKVNKDEEWQRFMENKGHQKGKLVDGRGGTWWMRCRLVSDKCMEVGDHMMILGFVYEAGNYRTGGNTGLVYSHGQYHTVGGVVHIDEEGRTLDEFETKEALGTQMERLPRIATEAQKLIRKRGFHRPNKILEEDEDDMTKEKT